MESVKRHASICVVKNTSPSLKTLSRAATAMGKRIKLERVNA